MSHVAFLVQGDVASAISDGSRFEAPDRRSFESFGSLFGALTMKEAEVYELQLGMVQAKQRCETLEAETAKLDQWKDHATSQIADLERQTAEGCEQVRLGPAIQPTALYHSSCLRATHTLRTPYNTDVSRCVWS
jgi:hypothetical protein